MLDESKTVFDNVGEGRETVSVGGIGHTVAAIVMETVVGTNGILVPPDG